MHADAGSNSQLKDLVARIETEKDPEEFTKLIQELNRLIDGDGRCSISRRAPESCTAAEEKLDVS